MEQGQVLLIEEDGWKKDSWTVETQDMQQVKHQVVLAY